ncbi:mannosylphosphorylation protein (Mnn4) [Metarhizium album ARSEF 1941]|uniref:Mannosylphosphorylation protein (Mnn4) n=1 Tax=Metarhizium album (strain ARSEF 1941) TaxID=1081103 RepID=A0A0B2WFJ6_METAS|nr:mannosylphosphorylation protein (Mnn4) [Metarhizium album ARSEF 1941]KHN94706.1 mannosylphosphorylation protein (Mnn4) [Metarhizium album ARSEF 1941]
MATGRERREGKLNERLRGAGRTNVDDNDTLSLDIPGIATGPAIQSSSSPGSVPAQPVARTSPPSRQTSNAPGTREDTASPYQPPGSADVPGARSSSAPRSAPSERDRPVSDEPEPVRPPSSAVLPRKAAAVSNFTEEVTESPAGKPGSGHRQRINEAVYITAAPTGRTPDITDEDDATAQPSSPLANKRPSIVARPSIPAVPEESEEEREETPSNQVRIRPPQQRPEAARGEPEEPEEPEESDHSDEGAVEIDDRRAAQSIGVKRPRPHVTRSPELGSEESEDNEPEEPLQKRHRRSPAAQRQPARRPKPQQRTRRHSTGSDGDDDAAIEITVQRFVNNFAQGADDEDELQQEIPFANRGGETVVDVFAQVCEEVISSTLETLRKSVQASDDLGKKKELRVRMRAIAAYREELGSRLLQHAIHLNHWHSLRRRLRHVQKEKLALRDEIIRLKGEREQVALRMDAVRIKHEADSKESTSRLNASSLMHDIDLAVEQGRAAPELSREEEKEADLGNLDLVLAQISDQISSTSSTGGLLQQIRDFNAFLERAAAALESG